MSDPKTLDCTGLTARWCPKCGACICDGSSLDDPRCPLHAESSQHGEESPKGREALLSVLRGTRIYNLLDNRDHVEQVVHLLTEWAEKHAHADLLEQYEAQRRAIEADTEEIERLERRVASMERELSALHEIILLENECAKCQGALQPSGEPPRCTDCVINEDDRHAWADEHERLTNIVAESKGVMWCGCMHHRAYHSDQGCSACECIRSPGEMDTEARHAR